MQRRIGGCLSSHFSVGFQRQRSSSSQRIPGLLFTTRRFCAAGGTVSHGSDDIDLFGIVEAIGSSVDRPKNASRDVVSQNSTRLGNNTSDTSAASNPVPSTESRQAAATAAVPSEQQKEVPTGGFPADPTEAAMAICSRSKALRDAMLRWSFEYHRPGRDGAICEPAVAVDLASRNLGRIVNAYLRGLRMCDSSPDGATTLRPHDTPEWEWGYIGCSADIADLRKRLAHVRNRWESGRNGNAKAASVRDTETRKALWVAASVTAASKIYAALPPEKRARVKTDSLSSPFAFLSAGLKVLDVKETPEIWTATFVAAAIMNIDDVFFDLLWTRYTDRVALDSGEGFHLDCTVAAMQWAAQRGDIQRLLDLFYRFSQREYPDGAIEVPLQLYTRVLRGVDGERWDGGLRAHIVQSLRRTLTTEQLRRSGWDEVAALLPGLDSPSAISLVRFRSTGRIDDVPYVVWLHLLRRLCREHQAAEAEAMFGFIRRRFSLSAVQRNITVSLLLKMYCSPRTPNFPAALHLFQTHIAETPPSLSTPGTTEAPVKPRLSHYRLLVRAADSADAANALWLEMLSDGIAPDSSLYAFLLASEAKECASASLGNIDFLPSNLDSLLRIPGSMDGHLARERALQSIGAQEQWTAADGSSDP